MLEEDAGEGEPDSRISLKPLRLHPEPVFSFIPEFCSGSPRNAVRIIP